MAQPWSAVEQSPEYQKLAPQEQSAAKEQYFSQVVAQKPEFQQLPDEEKQVAASQFMGAENKPPQDESMASPVSQGVAGIYDMAHQIPGVRQFMDVNPELADMRKEVPDPKGLAQNIGRGVGTFIGATPAMATGAEVLPATPMLGAALGAGSQETAGQLQEGKGPVQAGVSGAVTTAGTYLGGKAIEGALGAAKEVLKPVSEKISDTISDLYNKAVKPTIVRGNSTLLNQAKANVESGVRSIIENKDNLSLGDEGAQLPENLQHTSQAISDTKDAIFNKYNDLQKQATGKGVTINGQGLAQSLQPILDDKALEVVSPGTKKYAADLFERLQNAGDITPEEAQDMIKGFNGRLKAYYRNPSPDQYGNTAVDALVANNARKVLDDAITSEAGEGYQGLKRQYGALSSMEKDVSRAAQRTANYQNKGLLDFSDILTGEQVLRGVMSGNPIEIATGVGGRTIKEFYKKLNSPNSVIKDMFQKVDKYMGQEGQPALADKLAAVGKTVKDKINGLADMIPSRTSFGMAGKAGSNTPAEPVDAELMGGQALPAPTKPRTGAKYPSNDPTINNYGQPLVHNPLPMAENNIPKFKNTEEAIKFGQTNPKAVEKLKSLYEAGLEKNKQLMAAGDENGAFVNAQKNQLYREAMEAAQSKESKNIGKAAIGVVTGGGLIAGANNANASTHKPIDDHKAVLTLIGEAESGGLEGMRAVASAIRNRGTLQGAYGLNSKRVRNNMYSPKTLALAKQAWEDSKKQDYSGGGANHWFSKMDLTKPKTQGMIKKMKFLKSQGGNSFYKE